MLPDRPIAGVVTAEEEEEEDNDVDIDVDVHIGITLYYFAASSFFVKVGNGSVVQGASVMPCIAHRLEDC